jgi:hypothetical protein
MVIQLRKWQTWLAWGCLASLVAFQTWAFGFRLSLSLGPIVILQPWLLDHSFIEYKNIADQHSPLMPVILAVLRWLIPDGYHLALLVLVGLLALTCVLVFITSQRKAGWWVGVWAAGFFVLWSPAFGLQKLWYEVFLGPIFLAWLVTYRVREDPQPNWLLVFWGILGGIAVLIKQQAALAFVIFLLWHVLTSWVQHRPLMVILRQLVILCLAAFTPLLIYSLYYVARAGTLSDFLYWTIVYNLTSDYKALAAIAPTSQEAGWLISSGLLLPVALFCLFHALRKGDQTWLNFGLALSLLVASCIYAYPRFEFFHLAAALPLIAVISSMTLAYLWRFNRLIRWAVFGGALLLSVYWLATAGTGYQQLAMAKETRYIYEYSDLIPLAKQVQDIVPPEESIYLFPDDESTSNLYYLVQKTPPDFWIFHYLWYLSDWTRIKILDSLSGNPPDWVIYFPSHPDIEARAPDIVDYIQAHYQRANILQWSHGELWLLKRIE